GYLTESGVVNLGRVQLVMSELGKVEDEIFKKRRETELDFKRRDKQKKQRMKMQQNAQRPKWMMGGQFAPQALGRSGSSSVISNPRQSAYESRKQNMSTYSGAGGAAAELKSLLVQSGQNEEKGTKRKSLEQGGRGMDDDEEEEEAPDDVRLWEDGWRDRYYKSKFNVGPDDQEFRHNVANHYVRGLCWVLRYYYQGCASWKWYFPYHYAPFASDFVNIGDLANDFEKNTEPFQPLEQLMGVFPAASKKHLPITWQSLMEDPESPIIDFYPTDFKVDLNGKKFAWQGVALLPFVDETRLRKALETVYPDLTPQERKRNIKGNDRLFIGVHHPAFDFLEGLYEGGSSKDPLLIDPKLTNGMAGFVWCDEFNVVKGGIVDTPLPDVEDIYDNKCITVGFRDLQFDVDFIFKAVVLPGAVMPPPTLKPDDWNSRNPNQHYRPQLGFQPNSGYRNNKDMSAANRLIRNTAGMGGQGYVMSSQSLMPSLSVAIPFNYNSSTSQRGGYNNQQNRGRGGSNNNYQRGGSQQYGSRDGSSYNNSYNSNTSRGGYNSSQQSSYRGGMNQSGYGGQGYGGGQGSYNARGGSGHSNSRQPPGGYNSSRQYSDDNAYQSYPSSQVRNHPGSRVYDANRGRQQQDHGQRERYRPF
ncbi:5'-3' exoribonuclease 2, partial [Bulinus truncatus]